MNILPKSLIGPYKPKNFGKEYCEIKGSSQYPMFIAAALGIKPVFDDWIDVKKYHAYIEMCKKYGLFAEPDAVFSKTEAKKDNVIGGENIATTCHAAKRFSENPEDGEVHVFVSKSRESLLEAKKFGWYPVIINRRSLNKPYVDNAFFGKSLGYPECCIDFFRKYNNWHIYSNPYETFKNTLGSKSHYCNNFLMDKNYFYIHHLPCSYSCKKTIELAKKIEVAIKEVEPDFVEKANELLKKPLLIFREQNFILFDGIASGNRISYTYSQYIDNPSRPEETISFYSLIEEGNNLSLEGDKLIIRNNNSIIKIIEKKPFWFILDFDQNEP